MLTISLALTLASAPPPKIETIEWYGTVEIDSATDQLIALVPPVPGSADDGCKVLVTIDHSDGTPIVVEIRCDTLPQCAAKKRSCRKTQQGQTEGGGTIWGCPCAK